MRALGIRPFQFTFGILTAAVIAVALLLLLGSGSTEASHGGSTEGNFEVTYAAKPCTSTPFSTACTTGELAPGAARGFSSILTIPFPNRINFGNIVTFDPAHTTTPTCNKTLDGSGRHIEHTDNVSTYAAGTCLRSTDKVGTLSSDTQIGTNNNPCQITPAIVIDFDLYAVPTPDNPSDPRASTNIAYTRPEGAGSRFERWGTTPVTTGNKDFIAISGGSANNYTGPVADADNIMFKNYPEYLLDLFDKDGEDITTQTGKPIVPLAVYGGLTKVAGTPVPLYFVIFDEGALAAEFDPPNPFGQATANMGFPSQTVLNDPTQPVGNPSTVTAFCSTTPTTVLQAEVGDPADTCATAPASACVTRATNPDCTDSGGNGSECTALNLTWAASQRDLDNDGIENSLDTCPALEDEEGDPRVTGNDPNGDNIDNGCYPSPTPPNPTPPWTKKDIDGDEWPNQQDNCPLVKNDANLGSETLLGVNVGYTNGGANDGGPLGDSLGDKCDSEIGTLAVTYNTLAHTITTSDTVANGRWQVRALVTPICYGGTDADGDGYCAEDADANDTGFNAAIRHDSWTLTDVLKDVLGETSTTSAGSWDTDGGSGFSLGKAFDSDWLETYVGIDARQPCSLSSDGLVGDPLAPDEPLGAWIFDFNTDQTVDFGDILPIATFFNADATTDAHRRFDWNADGTIDFGDILGIAVAFNDTCDPIVLPQ